jgi:hypothetical protein
MLMGLHFLWPHLFFKKQSVFNPSSAMQSLELAEVGALCNLPELELLWDNRSNMKYNVWWFALIYKITFKA